MKKNVANLRVDTLYANEIDIVTNKIQRNLPDTSAKLYLGLFKVYKEATIRIRSSGGNVGYVSEFKVCKGYADVPRITGHLGELYVKYMFWCEDYNGISDRPLDNSDYHLWLSIEDISAHKSAYVYVDITQVGHTIPQDRSNYITHDITLMECKRSITSNYYTVSSLIMNTSDLEFSSDDRLKRNEKLITESSCLLKLRPQVYDKLSKIGGDIKNSVHESGLIAQEIWYDCPELRHLVKVGESGKPDDAIATSDDPTVDPDYSSWGPEAASVNYTGFIPYLIKGYQEHSEKLNVIESQKVEIFELKKENERIKSQIASHEAQIAMLMKACGLTDSGNVES